MDIAEKIFGHFTFWRRERARSLRLAFEITLESQLPTARLLAQSNLPILPTQGVGGISRDALWLPERISLFPDRDLNRFLLGHKAAVAGSLARIFGDSLPKTAMTMVDDLKREVEKELSLLHPRYLDWRNEYVSRLNCCFESVRNPSYEQSQALWVEILSSLPLTSAPDQLHSLSERQGRGAEKPRPASGPIEVIDLAAREKEDNPVHHSFEKIETADDYHGGYRQTDGSDQLQEHSGALEDLELNKVTRDGAPAQSLYAADLHTLSPEGRDQAELIQGLTYPEWDYRRRTFRENHCRLSVAPAELGGADEGHTWLKRLEETYRLELRTWQARMERVFNKPLWRDRQLDGPEFSIEAWIAHCADARHGASGEPRLFLRQKKRTTDVAIFILFDQSYSTDSYVQGCRILDVELEAIGLMGRLMDNPCFQVAVASTWSETRHNCRFEVFKGFKQEWTAFFRAASRAKPSGYTRLGPAIRHATGELSRLPARDRLLLLLTDGRPTDYDSYEGHYGIEDVRHALLESAQAGVKVQALAVENHAKHYFPQLFGVGGYRVLSRPAQLPSRLFEILVETLAKK